MTKKEKKIIQEKFEEGKLELCFTCCDNLLPNGDGEGLYEIWEDMTSGKTYNIPITKKRDWNQMEENDEWTKIRRHTLSQH